MIITLKEIFESEKYDFQFIEIPNSESLSIEGEITISAWIFQEFPDGEGGTIFSTESNNYSLSSSTESLTWNSKGNNFETQHYYEPISKPYEIVEVENNLSVGGPSLDSGMWYNVTLVMRQEERFVDYDIIYVPKVYINGQEVERFNVNQVNESGIIDGKDPLFLGINYPSIISGWSSNPWSGGIDDFRIWDVALDSSEIWSLLTDDDLIKSEHLILEYDFESIDDTTVIDISGNQNHGEIFGELVLTDAAHSLGVIASEDIKHPEWIYTGRPGDHVYPPLEYDQGKLKSPSGQYIYFEGIDSLRDDSLSSNYIDNFKLTEKGSALLIAYSKLLIKHGDKWTSIHTQGALDAVLSESEEFLFVLRSNQDGGGIIDTYLTKDFSLQRSVDLETAAYKHQLLRATDTSLFIIEKNGSNSQFFAYDASTNDILNKAKLIDLIPHPLSSIEVRDVDQSGQERLYLPVLRVVVIFKAFLASLGRQHQGYTFEWIKYADGLDRYNDIQIKNGSIIAIGRTNNATIADHYSALGELLHSEQLEAGSEHVYNTYAESYVGNLEFSKVNNQLHFDSGLWDLSMAARERPILNGGNNIGDTLSIHWDPEVKTSETYIFGWQISSDGLASWDEIVSTSDENDQGQLQLTTDYHGKFIRGVLEFPEIAGGQAIYTNPLIVGSLKPSKPQLTSDSDTGIFNTDGLTSNNTPTLTGQAMPEVLIQIFDGDLYLGETEVDGDGNWSYTLPEQMSLSDGAHYLTARTIDKLGFESDYSEALQIVVDTVAPRLDLFPRNLSIINGQPKLPYSGVKGTLAGAI